MSDTLREAKWKVTVSVWQDKEVVQVQAGYHEDSYGAAVDIGSTTVALYLCNLRTGEILAAESEMNPQIVYGEDVMSRIQYTIEQSDGLEKFHKSIMDALNRLLRRQRRRRRSRRTISWKWFWSAIPPCTIWCSIFRRTWDLAPFVPTLHKSVDVKARELGLAINPSGNIHVLPIAASFVGADTSAMLIAESPISRMRTGC